MLHGTDKKVNLDVHGRRAQSEYMSTVLTVFAIETLLGIALAVLAVRWARAWADKPTRAQRRLARAARIRPGVDLVEPCMMGDRR